MIKLIYLAQKKTGFSRDAFLARWRRHGALGMAQPMWRHAIAYIQAEPTQPALIQGLSEDYDAIATFCLGDNMFADLGADDAEGAQIMAADELETFATPIPEVSLWVTEEAVKPGDLGGFGAYLFYQDATAAAAAATVAASDDRTTRVFLNQRNDNLLGNRANTLPFAAVVEFATASLDALRELLNAEREVFCAADVAVATQEAVLWDRLASWHH
jgi:hypothetical protein